MDDHLLKEITEKIQEINKAEREMYGINYLPHEQAVEILEQPPSTVRESLMSFNQSQYSQRTKIFRKTHDYDDLTGQNESETKQFNPDEISQGTEEFLKPWGKLDKQQKINRLMDYVNTLIETMSLSQEQVMQLRSLLITAVNDRKITRKNEVDYCDSTGKILKIPELKQNPENKKFYLGRDDTNTNLSGVTVKKLNPVKKLDLNSLKTGLPKKNITIIAKTTK